jgi:dTDP-4-dehydrorhamnose 3,5-epimerase
MSKISTVLATPLDRISVIGGDVLHALKCTEDSFVGFGEAYFSTIELNAIKAWKRHNRMTMNLVVPFGHAKFVFAYGCGEFVCHQIGDHNYQRLTVPPGVWFGFQGLSQSCSLILNISDVPHDPSEVDRLPMSSINYSWD